MLRCGTGSAFRVLLGVSLLLAGCATQTTNPHPGMAAGRQGLVHGGEQPVTGATIQLYAVGTSANGSPSSPLLTSPVVTDASGYFSVTGKYTCPSAASLVYVTATGGNPGLAPGTSNAALALMAALGPCGSLTPSTFIYLNELTTVAAVYALAPYMSSISSVGSDLADAGGLTNAFTFASELVNTATGTTPGVNVPAGDVVPVQQINTVADILAACVNSTGGTAGDNSPCGTLFSLTTLPAGTAAPTNTASALLQIANHPGVNTASLYNLTTPTAPFQPSQPQVPPDLSVRLLANSGLTVTPAVLTFPPARVGNPVSESITITNNTAAPIGLDAADPEGFSISGTDAGDYSVLGGFPFVCPSPLLPGSSCTVQISFKPEATGPRTAYYVLPNTSANSSLAVALNGTGLEAAAGPASLSPSSLNLQTTGTPSFITLTNSGTGPLTIDGISISNDPTSGQPAFTQSNNCGASLSAAASCTVSITALATSQPYTSGVLTVNDDASGGPQTAALSYSNGFAGAVLIDFPDMAVGTSYTDYLNRFQAYPSPLTLTITGPNATDFSFSASSSSQTATCTSYGRPPTSCSNAITFTPSGPGVRVASLNISGDQYTGASYGGLVGVGLTPGLHLEPLMQNYGVSPNPTIVTSLQFSTLTTGQTFTQYVQVFNNGTVPFTLNPPALTGPGASTFSVANSCTSAVAPGQGCQVAVTAQASASGSFTATLTLSDTTGAASSSISLVAYTAYPQPVVTPSSLNFPYTPEGTVSAPINFTITTSNNDPVFLRIGSDGPGNPFVLTNGNSCPRTPCQLTAVYEPTAANSSGNGTVGTTFYVYDLYADGLTQVSVSGSFIPPYVLSASPASLDFGTEPYGTVSDPKLITLSNGGTQDINYTLAFSPDGAVTTDPNFMAGSTNGQLIVQSGGTGTISVNFYPTVLGQDTATLYIFSNAPNSPIAIKLSGTGQ